MGPYLHDVSGDRPDAAVDAHSVPPASGVQRRSRRRGFSTDITPTLYALLGYPQAPGDWPLGGSLFVPRGTDISWRRHDPALLASSYGPVLCVLRDNGQMLYIADGVNARDYEYDVSRLKAIRAGVTPRMRTENRAFIRDKVATLASLYRFAPNP